MAKDGSLFLVEKANEKSKTGGGTTEKPDFGIKHKTNHKIVEPMEMRKTAFIN